LSIDPCPIHSIEIEKKNFDLPFILDLFYVTRIWALFIRQDKHVYLPVMIQETNKRTHFISFDIQFLLRKTRKMRYWNYAIFFYLTNNWITPTMMVVFFLHLFTKLLSSIVMENEPNECFKDKKTIDETYSWNFISKLFDFNEFYLILKHSIYFFLFFNHFL
jgi:hypothetical protein